ncbi:MAG: hypothetical protein EBU88_06845 [Acidobacteria bacterium]|nr:hypothetical protein [Acidobacteriota bacterium]
MIKPTLPLPFGAPTEGLRTSRLGTDLFTGVPAIEFSFIEFESEEGMPKAPTVADNRSAATKPKAIIMAVPPITQKIDRRAFCHTPKLGLICKESSAGSFLVSFLLIYNPRFAPIQSLTLPDCEEENELRQCPLLTDWTTSVYSCRVLTIPSDRGADREQP